MHVRFEHIQRPSSFSDSIITSLSWMRHSPNHNSNSSSNNNQRNHSSSNNNNNNNAQQNGDGIVLQELPIVDLNNNDETIPNNNDNNNNDNNVMNSGHYQQQLNNNNNNNHHPHNLHREPFVQHYHTHPNVYEDNVENNNNNEEVVNNNGAVNELELADSSNSESVNQRPESCSDQAKEGWLAVGNAHGVVGVSFTSTRPFDYCFGDSDDDPLDAANYANGDWRRPLPGRTNYNLRGHRAEITLVRWNEPYQKLATCDEAGVIFIWIKYEGRWSVELINDRNARVTDMAWSSDGRLAVICYVDGFVLVGSVTGQRYWSSMLNLNEGHVTCCVWSGDDQNILFATSSGHVLVISAHGQYITQVSVQACVAISGLAWAWPLDHKGDRLADWNAGRGSSLAVAFADGAICLLNNYDDPMPEMVRTELSTLRMCWSTSGRVLAVGGHRTRAMSATRNSTVLFKTTYVRYDFINIVQIYSRRGALLSRIKLDYEQASLSTLVWGNNDTRLFVACGKLLLVGWVSHQVPTLAHLARIKTRELLLDKNRPKRLLLNLDLPWPVRGAIHEVLTPTICCHLPDYSRIREFVFRPPPHNIRLYCTLIRHSPPNELSKLSSTITSRTSSTSGTSAGATSSRSNTPVSSFTDDDSIYVLYLEYLGGLVPILKGKRSSKLKTEFVIYDPVNSVDGERIDIHNHDFDAGGQNISNRNSSVGQRMAPSVPTTSDEDEDDDDFDIDVPSDEDINNSDYAGPTSGVAFSFLTEKTRRRLLHLRSAQIRRFFRSDRDGEIAGANNTLTPSTTRRRRLRGRNGFSEDDDDESEDDESFRNAYIQRLYRRNSNRNSLRNNNQRILHHENDLESRTNNKTSTTLSGNSRGIHSGTSKGQKVVRPVKIVMVRSNIWGTKFKFLSVSPMLPARLGSMNYRTSFLHLQPRQMALTIKEMHRDNTTLSPPMPQQSSTTSSTGSSTFGRASRSGGTTSEDSDSDFSLCDSDSSDIEQPVSTAIVPLSPPRCVRNSLLIENENVLLNRRPLVNRSAAQEEFLTLAIAEPAIPGNSAQYSVEMSAKPEPGRSLTEPAAVVESNVASPKQQQPTTSSSMVRQFKHQTFHSESPKHVRKQREPMSKRAPDHSIHSACDVARPPPFCAEIRTKMLKESPSRKASSTVACSSADFSPTKPTTAYYRPEIEVDSVVKVPISALGDIQTVCQMFEETCALVAAPPTAAQTTTAPSTISASTSLILDTPTPVSPPLQIRRRQFQQQSSKSYDLQSAIESSTQLDDSHSSQLHLNNIEQAVKALSGKLNSSHIDAATDQSSSRRPSTVAASSTPTPTSTPRHIDNNNTNEPCTPQRKSYGLHMFKSPMMVRKMMRRKLSYLDCTSGGEFDGGNLSELDSQDKRPKSATPLRKTATSTATPTPTSTPVMAPKVNKTKKKSKCRVEPECQSRNFHLHNKAPMWNEVTQVYQLDFGGRVTQESAKNFQIEHNGKQVMQFGRIDKNAYTLDFEYPFSAIQALSVALANVTQRFK